MISEQDIIRISENVMLRVKFLEAESLRKMRREARRAKFAAWFWKLAGLGALACICGVMWFEVLR
jgi:hypothetical protein